MTVSLSKSIYSMFNSGTTITDEDKVELGASLAGHIQNAVGKREPGGKLRASNLGTKCKRKLWYTVNRWREAEVPAPEAQNKFTYGHIIEDYVMWMLKRSGRDVRKRQQTVGIATRDGTVIEGHIDGIVDGVLVDCKSANSRGMEKFTGHKLAHDDPFGYLDQLDFYRAALIDDPDLSDKNKIQFIAVDKELGKIHVDEYDRSHIAVEDVRAKVQDAVDLTRLPDVPDRGYFAIPDGASGNLQLDMPCRYCEYKWICWPSLRQFIYANGPRWLTLVKRVPDVPESKRPTGPEA